MKLGVCAQVVLAVACNPAERVTDALNHSEWMPSDLPDGYTLQWALDGGDAYHSSRVESYDVLRSREPYDSYRRPRSRRHFLFDGTDDYATITDASLALTGEMAVTAWIKTTSDITNQAIAAYCSGGAAHWSFTYSYTDGKLGWWHDGAGEVATSNAALGLAGAWHHVAAVRSGSSGNWTITFYVDGVAAGSGTTITNPTTGEVQAFAIGRFGSYAGQYFNGSIRDVRVYNVTKTAAQIAAIYNQADTPETVDLTGILGWWHGVEEGGNIAFDASGNGKDLTITGATLTNFHSSSSQTESTNPITWNPANNLGLGLAQYFNGTNAYAKANSAILSGTGDFAITGWFRSAVADASSRTLVANYSASNTSGFQVSFYNSRVQIYIGGSWFSGATALAANAWHHFAVVRTSGTVKIYVNGTEDASASHPASIGSSSDLHVGALNGTAEYFNGYITDLRIYNVSKSAAEISTIKAGTADTTGLVARWHSKYDLGSNGHHLQVTNAVEVVIPRNEADPTKDVMGLPILHNGMSAYPIVIENFGLTGNGTDVYASLGAIGTASDFTVEFVFYLVTTASRMRLVDCRNNAATYKWSILTNADPATGTVVANQLCVELPTSTSLKIPSALTQSNWHKVRLSRSGDTWTLTCENLTDPRGTYSASTTDSQTFDSAAECYLLGGYNNAGAAGISLPSNSTMCGLSILQGGVTKTFPMEEGAGIDGSNRDLYWVADDGTYGHLSSAVVNGSPSSAFGTRNTGQSQSWPAKHGGRLSDTYVFIPGVPNSSLAADGNAKTIPAGYCGQPRARIHFDRWNAAELTLLRPQTNTPDFRLLNLSLAYADMGEALIPATGDWTLEFVYTPMNDTAIGTVFSQTTNGLSDGRIWLLQNSNGGVMTAGALQFYVHGTVPVDFSITGAVTAGNFHRVTITRVGETFTVTTRNLSTGAAAVSGNATATTAITHHTGRNTWFGARSSDAHTYGTLRVGEIKMVTGGVTTVIPGSDGPWANSNRDLAKYVDNVGSVVSNALTGSTPNSLFGAAYSSYAAMFYGQNSNRAVLTRDTKFWKRNPDGLGIGKIVNLRSAASGTNLDKLIDYLD